MDPEYVELVNQFKAIYISNPEEAGWAMRNIINFLNKRNRNHFYTPVKLDIPLSNEDLIPAFMKNPYISSHYKEYLMSQLDTIPEYMLDHYAETSIPVGWGVLTDDKKKEALDRELDEYKMGF